MDDLLASQLEKIPCPALRIAVRTGMVKLDENGWVEKRDLAAYLDAIGVKSRSVIGRLLLVLGVRSNVEPQADKIQLTGFADTRLDHGSSSGILNDPPGGFSPLRFERLKQLSSNGKGLSTGDLANAAEFFHQYPGKYVSSVGTLIQSLEFATILNIFGRDEPGGEKYLSFDDMDRLWRDSLFPRGWEPPKKPFFGSIPALRATFKQMRLRRQSKL